MNKLIQKLQTTFLPNQNNSSIVLCDSIASANDLAFMLGGEWDNCNSITLTKCDRVALTEAAALIGTKWCYCGDNVALFAKLSETELITRYKTGERNFINANLRCSRLDRASAALRDRICLRDANLSHAFLNEAKLDRVDLSNAELSAADASNADLSQANLSQAKLFRTNLTEANLENANLSGAKLYRACLRRANLAGANLDGADLSFADLRGANLNNTSLSGANLKGAMLTVEQPH